LAEGENHVRVSLDGERSRRENALGGKRGRDLDLASDGARRPRQDGAERLDGIGLGRGQRREEGQALTRGGRRLSTARTTCLALLSRARRRAAVGLGKVGAMERRPSLNVGQIAR
jgi:hypothetical protein